MSQINKENNVFVLGSNCFLNTFLRQISICKSETNIIYRNNCNIRPWNELSSKCMIETRINSFFISVNLF